MQLEYTLTSFYKFLPLTEPDAQAEAIEQDMEKTGARGLILVGTEGVNGSICLPSSRLEQAKSLLTSRYGDLPFKDSPGTPSAFLKLKVKVKPEIVTMGAPELVPNGLDHHLSPAEYHQKILAGARIVDTRNDYEMRIGKFRGAVDLDLQDFSEFPERLKNSDLKKTEETLIYCTGGIRCEKAILEMRRQGFEKVYQLNGGILKYLEEFGSEGAFEGECFVFDYRVALDGDLRPSQQFRLCPHCGEPTAQMVDCKMCGESQHVCEKCLHASEHHRTCSKNCAHHSREGHRSQRRHLDGRRKA